jgi:hypothetical protein
VVFDGFYGLHVDEGVKRYFYLRKWGDETVRVPGKAEDVCPHVSDFSKPHDYDPTYQ